MATQTPASVGSRRYRLSVDQYLKAIEAGVFPDDARVRAARGDLGRTDDEIPPAQLRLPPGRPPPAAPPPGGLDSQRGEIPGTGPDLAPPSPTWPSSGARTTSTRPATRSPPTSALSSRSPTPPMPPTGDRSGGPMPPPESRPTGSSTSRNVRSRFTETPPGAASPPPTASPRPSAPAPRSRSSSTASRSAGSSWTRSCPEPRTREAGWTEERTRRAYRHSGGSTGGPTGSASRSG